MICKNCNSENLLKADYCRSCGSPFTQEEKESARSKTLVGVLEKAEDLKGKADKISDILSLKFITDNVFVRLALLVLPFIFTMLTTGGAKGMGIMDTDEYEVYYNTTTKEYFVEMTENFVALEMYIPNDTELVEISFENNGSQYIVGTFETSADLILDKQSSGHYTISAISGGNVTDSIVVYTV